jgi:adenine-specific DNA-methyltransferase
MATVGSFTDFLFPHDESLFEEAAVDILVFRYEKGLLQKTTQLNNKTMLCNISNGIITFSDKEIKGTALSTLFDVYVGLVSGKDEVYKNPMGNITILNDKDKLDKYIFVKTYPSNIVDIDTHLKLHKSQLLDRRIKKFNEKNWFEWGAPRNIKTIEQNLGKPCIYVRNMSRSQTVAFIDKVQYFGGSLLCLIPKQTTTPVQIKSTVEFLNSNELQKDYIYSGRFKIGHKQVCNIVLP